MFVRAGRRNDEIVGPLEGTLRGKYEGNLETALATTQQVLGVAVQQGGPAVGQGLFGQVRGIPRGPRPGLELHKPGQGRFQLGRILRIGRMAKRFEGNAHQGPLQIPDLDAAGEPLVPQVGPAGHPTLRQVVAHHQAGQPPVEGDAVAVTRIEEQFAEILGQVDEVRDVAVVQLGEEALCGQIRDERVLDHRHVADLAAANAGHPLLGGSVGPVHHPGAGFSGKGSEQGRRQILLPAVEDEFPGRVRTTGLAVPAVPVAAGEPEKDRQAGKERENNGANMQGNPGHGRGVGPDLRRLR